MEVLSEKLGVENIKGLPRYFDESALAELIEIEREGETNLVRELMNDYIATTPKLMAQIEMAILTRDVAELELRSHSLKSSSRLLGLELISNRCASLEDGAKRGHIQEHVFELLKIDFGPSVESMKKYLKTR